MSSLLNKWVETIQDQLQSLAQIFQIGCRICGVPHFDGEYEGHAILGIGCLDSQLNPYSPPQYQSFEVNPHSTSNIVNIDSSSDLVEPVTQVVDESVVTRLEASTDTVPPPCPEYNILIDQKTIRSKVGFASGLPYKPSLHHIMMYMDTFDQPVFSNQPREVLEVERFIIPPVEPLPHFETSPCIGHTLPSTSLKLSGYMPMDEESLRMMERQQGELTVQ